MPGTSTARSLITDVPTRPFTYSNGELSIDGLGLPSLAAEFGTPLYVYSAANIRHRLALFEQAFAPAPHTVCYAVKASSSLALLQLLGSLGAGFDIVSGGELERVRRACPHALPRVVFSGVGKQLWEIDAALHAGILLFNVESAEELDLLAARATTLGKPARFALRVNPDVFAETHPYISTGLREHKFGIDISLARDLYRYAATLPSLRATGVSVHIGSQIQDVGPFAEALTRVATLIQDLRADGHTITHIDLGGGLGIDYLAPLTTSSVLPTLNSVIPRLNSLIPYLNSPIPTEVEGPASPRLNSVIPTEVEGPASPRLNSVIPTEVEGPASPRLNSVIPHLNSVIPTEVEGPASPRLAAAFNLVSDRPKFGGHSERSEESPHLLSATERRDAPLATDATSQTTGDPPSSAPPNSTPDQQVTTYAQALLPALSTLNCHLLLEPGRFLVAQAGALLTRVLGTKQNGSKRFVITDAAMNDLIRPALYQAHHEILPVTLSELPPQPALSSRPDPERATRVEGGVEGPAPPAIDFEAVDIVGPVCESGDFFAHDRPLPPLAPGDLLLLLDAGAYGMSQASNYNTRPRPAELLIDQGRAHLIRRRETLDDLLAPEILL